jgi:hypothetical protein
MLGLYRRRADGSAVLLGESRDSEALARIAATLKAGGSDWDLVILPDSWERKLRRHPHWMPWELITPEN